MPQVYGSYNGVSKAAQKMYVGVNGASKEIQTMYVGVNGAAVKVYPAIEPDTFLKRFIIDRSATSFSIIRG